MTAQGDGFLTVRELADLAGVRESTVLWWLRGGHAPASEHVHGRTLFRAAAVDDWIAQFSGRVSPSLAVARLSSSISSSTSLAASRVFADDGAAA